MDRQFDVLLVRELAAERSGCRWCIDRARHDWRVAGLSVDLLRSLARHATSAGLSERDRAALALVDAVACGGGSADSGAALLPSLSFSGGGESSVKKMR